MFTIQECTTFHWMNTKDLLEQRGKSSATHISMLKSVKQC